MQSFFVAGLVGALLMFGPSPSRAEPATITLATATKGGGFQLYGNAAAAVISATDPSLKITAKDTKGSLENIPLLLSGQVDLGLVQGVAAYEAFAGIGQQAADLKVIAAIYSSPGLFVVSGDSPVGAVADLIGKRIAWGTPNSGLTLMAKYIMDGLGYDRDTDFESVFLGKAGEGPPLIAEGKVDAFWGAGIGWPGFTKVMASGGRFVGFTPGEVAKVTARHAFLKAMTVPAGSYEGQANDVQTIGVWSFILARPGLSDDVAYRVAKALHQGNGALSAQLPQAHETTPQNTRASADGSL